MVTVTVTKKRDNLVRLEIICGPAMARGIAEYITLAHEVLGSFDSDDPMLSNASLKAVAKGAFALKMLAKSITANLGGKSIKLASLKKIWFPKERTNGAEAK